MTTHPRRWSFGLPALFAGVLAVAVPLGWVAAQLRWVHDRNLARQSVFYGCGSDWGTKHAWWDPWMRRVPVLPWSLKLLHENCECLIAADLDLDSVDGVKKGAQLLRLFPESAIVVVNRRTDGTHIYTWLQDPLALRSINVASTSP